MSKQDCTRTYPTNESEPCGDSRCQLTWRFDNSSGTLTIEGIGRMDHWTEDDEMPWSSFASEIKAINLVKGVTNIGEYAFLGCTGLTSVEIPDSVTGIGEYAFRHCTGLTSVEIPSGVTEIGDDAFRGCDNLTSIVVSDNNKSYRSINGVLYNADGTILLFCPRGQTGKIIVPEGVMQIKESAFDDCKSLTSVEIPSSLRDIGEFAFNDCEKLRSITIPEGVKHIEQYAFSGCRSLMSVEIPDSVTDIGEGAFSDCENLRSISIPEGVSSIGERAFFGCTNLSSVRLESGPTERTLEVEESCFADTDVCTTEGEGLKWSYEEACAADGISFNDMIQVDPDKTMYIFVPAKE